MDVNAFLITIHILYYMIILLYVDTSFIFFITVFSIPLFNIKKVIVIICIIMGYTCTYNYNLERLCIKYNV